MHSRISGVTDHLALNDPHSLAIVRQIVANLNWQKAPNIGMEAPAAPKYDPEELYGVVPTDLQQPYDVRELIARVVDGSEFDEFKQLYGTTLVCGFAKLFGYPVGIVANKRHPVLGERPERRALS